MVILRSLFIFHTIFAIVLWTQTNCLSEIIPVNRRMNWEPGGTVGVPGGIPKRTTIFVNVKTTENSSYHCAGDGVTDDGPALQAALLACPKDQVVYVPTGTYRLQTRVVVAGARHQNYTLRGDGMGKTIFLSDGAGAFAIGSGQNPIPIESSAGSLRVTAGATVGSTVLTVADASSIKIGNLITLLMDTPTWMHTLTRQTELFKMNFKVTAKTATTVTITPPIPWNVSGFNPRILPWGHRGSGLLTQGVGLEDFTINSTRGGLPIQMNQTWGCWIKNVELFRTSSRHMFLNIFCAGEIRGCHTHDTQGGGPNHQGIDLAHNCDWNLVEDNICINAGSPPIIIGDGGRGACVGNVIAYNYVEGGNTGSTSVSGFCFSDNHQAGGNMLNLFEGNVGMGFVSDGYFGGSSYTTLLRNYFHNKLEPPHTSGLAPIAVALNHYSVYYNIVGNVLGSPERISYYDSEARRTGFKNLIYRLGYPNVGNGAYDTPTNTEGVPNPDYGGNRIIEATTPPDYTKSPHTILEAQALDLNVKNTIIRHGNYDYATKNANGTARRAGVVWETDDARGTGVDFTDHTIPKSYYLSTKPSWWPTTVPWPPIGPDKDPMVSAIPAEIRFKALKAPPPKPPASSKVTSAGNSTSP
jgi:hypothetical protein